LDTITKAKIDIAGSIGGYEALFLRERERIGIYEYMSDI
jgi:hypothetical protein